MQRIMIHNTAVEAITEPELDTTFSLVVLSVFTKPLIFDNGVLLYTPHLPRQPCVTFLKDQLFGSQYCFKNTFATTGRICYLCVFKGGVYRKSSFTDKTLKWKCWENIFWRKKNVFHGPETHDGGNAGVKSLKSTEVFWAWADRYPWYPPLPLAV